MRNLVHLIAAAILAFGLGCGGALAQVPVYDSANTSAAQQVASNTSQILAEDQQIRTLQNQILSSLTGQRTSEAQAGGLSTAGLGGGNSVASAPSWGSLMQGGTMSWGSMTGSSTSLASQIINGLQLVKSIASIVKGASSGTSASNLDQVFSGAVNTATLLAALTDTASQGVTARQSAFTTAGQQIGTATDVKGSVDQNTQAQIQVGQTVNQLIGVQNGAVAALNAKLIETLTRQSQVSQMVTYDASSSDPFK